MEYLYSQTGRVLQDVSVDPDVPDEQAAFSNIETEDEGFEEVGGKTRTPASSTSPRLGRAPPPRPPALLGGLSVAVSRRRTRVRSIHVVIRGSERPP